MKMKIWLQYIILHFTSDEAIVNDVKISVDSEGLLTVFAN